MGFQVISAAKMKMTVSWDVTPCNLVEINQCFIEVVHHFSGRPDDSGSKHLRNIGRFLQDYLAHHPTRQLSSCVLLLYLCGLTVVLSV
jgi:hypothetical protein